jgi:hypothetical protein
MQLVNRPSAEYSLSDTINIPHQNSQAPRAMNAATNTIAMTSTISAWLIRRNVTTENRGSDAPCFRADRMRMNVIIGVTSRAKINANKATFTQKKPLYQ